MYEICDECGNPTKAWYDFWTLTICPECLKEHRVSGVCDHCGDAEPFWLYSVNGETICDECIRFYERGET